MARLKVRLRGKVVSEIPLAEDRQYLAGRKDGCDIQLAGEKGISREHFRMSCQNGHWQIEGLSRFGELLVGGERVETISLEHGLTFTVPPYDFEFLMTSADSPSIENPPAVADEMHLPGDDGGGASGAILEAGPIEKTVVGVAPSVPYMKVMDSQGEARELIRLEGGDSWLAGRDSSCAIHIRDQRVSRRQFEVRKHSGSYFIIDLGSVNGTLLNGNPISSNEPTPLKSGDAVSVLENYFYFELHDPNFKSRLELVSLQPLPEVPPAGMLVPIQGQDPLPPQAQAAPMPPVPMGYQVPMDPSMYHPQGGHLPQQWHGAGMPMPYDPNMLHHHHPAMAQPGGVPAPKKFDFEKNRPKVIAAAVALLGLVYFGLGGTGNEAPKAAAPLIQDPYSKLTPDQQKLVRDTYQLAKVYFQQGKYELARGEIIKMTEHIPEYEDSKGLLKLIDEAQYVQEQQRKQEELEKSRREQEEKIQRKVAECGKLIGPTVTRDQIESCLFDVINFNPTHPGFAQLYMEVDRITADRMAKDARDAAYRSDVAKLKNLYGKAAALEANRPLAAIVAHQRVIASTLPDPSGLRATSKQKVEQIKAQLNSKTADLQESAKKNAEAGNYRDAILALRRAQKVDPQNTMLQGQIDEYTQKLKELMMVIYQEGILEENFGNIEGGENKEGAKKKWMDIISKDIPDGEYYRKAMIKLKKYGAK